jgi:hypothetical protein
LQCEDRFAGKRGFRRAPQQKSRNFLDFVPSLLAMHAARVFSLVLTARHLLCLLCVVLALGGLSGCGKRSIDSGAGLTRPGTPGGVLATVRSQIGVPYTMGGSTPKTGFDCSGLLYWSYRQHGVNIPRTTGEQAGFGRLVSRADLKPGDIVVFRISGKQGLHTGVASGGGRFIHSPSTGGKVREESLSTSYWKPRFVSGRRVFYSNSR